MSLLDDLGSIDMSGIVSAKGSISASVQAPGLQAVLSGGAAQTALAGLGASLGSIRESFPSPEALLKPVVDAVGKTGVHFDPSKVNLSDLESAISSGLGMIIQPVQSILSDPVAAIKLLPIDLSGATAGLKTAVPGFTHLDVNALSQFRGMFDLLDKGLPSDPSAFSKIAVQMLMPFPGLDLHELRAGVDMLHGGIGGIRLPKERTNGLVIAFDAVATAAATGDKAKLNAALKNLEQVRSSTIHAIETELYAVVAAIDKLHITDILGVITTASNAIRAVEGGILELLEKWRLMVRAVRSQIEQFEPNEIKHFIEAFVKMAEDFAQKQIGARFDEAAKKLEKFVRDLFSHIPIVELRNDVSAFFHKAAQAIADAHLDAVANEIHAALEAVRSKLDADALTGAVNAALKDVKEVIHAALDKVVAALNQITSAVNAVAGNAEGILKRAAEAIGDFKKAMDGITQTIEHLGVKEAAQQVVHTISELREVAEKLLSAAPLPESMRPTVQQLIDTLNSVDFDEAFKPVEDAAKQFHIPDDEKAAITAGLQKAADAVAHLIPDQLIAEIDAEIKHVLDTVTGFDPGKLLPDVSKYLDEAAKFITDLDPRPHVDAIRKPYLAVLEALDKVKPSILLEPVCKAYDSVLGGIDLGGGSGSFLSKIGDVISGAVNKAGDAITSPLNNLLSQASGASPDSGAQATSGTSASGGQTASGGGQAPEGSAAPANPPGATDTSQPAQPPESPPAGAPIRPGDLIRLFGFIPAKLKEGLHALDAGVAGQVLREIDSVGAGLARDLRATQRAIAEIEATLSADLDAMLLPVSAAQARAQAAIHAKFQADGVTMSFALNGVAQSGPGSIKDSLVQSSRASRDRIKQAVNATVGAEIDKLATALERSRLASLTGDLDALLEALDPEPLAKEVDALAEAMFKKAPELLEGLREGIDSALNKIESLLHEFNPGVQAHKFLIALKPLAETLDLLNPRRLAAELDEIHAEIRKALTAYDPATLAADVAVTLEAIAGGIKALDPKKLLGDLSFLNDIKAKIEAASPAKALAGVGEGLNAVGKQLAELDPAAMLTAVEGLAPKMVDAFKEAAEAIRNEVVALLEALKFGGANASVSVSASASVG